MHRSILLLAGAVWVAALLAAPRAAAQPVGPAPAGRLDLSRLVVVGDSLSAGVQDGTLSSRHQRASYAARLAEQAGAALTFPALSGDAAVEARNLAVPGARAADALPQAARAGRLAPSAVLLWIGSNDVLSAATSGDASRATAPAAFARTYHELVARLARTGVPLILANVADVTRIPASRVAGRQAAAVRAVTDAYNRTIAEEARAAGALLVDVAGLFDRVAAEGLEVAGRRLTIAPGGGLFSSDGVHPNDLGHAAVANAFIEALNGRFGAGIPTVRLADLLAKR